MDLLREIFGIQPRRAVVSRDGPLDEDGWEIPQRATSAIGVEGFEDYLRGLEREGALEALTFHEQDDGEIEIKFELDETWEGDINRRLRELVELGLVEDVTPSSNGSATGDSESSATGDSESSDSGVC